ncbi:MAG: hypothetical protein M3347_11495 [Armatimonadota bacterium]|nr:hypothetical protein [Armatimonadota bacterium]
MTINGYSQPGSSANTLATGNNAVILIRVNGASAGADADGFTFTPTTNNSSIQGLTISGFDGAGGRLQSTAVAVNGCAITGNNDGVFVDGCINNTIGAESIAFQTSSPDERNVISGNRAAGVRIAPRAGVGGTQNLVANSYIGTDAAGTARVGNGDGIVVDGSENRIGARNSNVHLNNNAVLIVAGNRGDGVVLRGHSNIVRRTFIGVGGDGTTPLGNRGDGVQIGASGAPANNNVIGNNADTALVRPTEGTNLIAFNGTTAANHGINVVAGTGNTLATNQVFSNTGLGIELVGVNNNDNLDPDSGPDNGQNILSNVSTAAT